MRDARDFQGKSGISPYEFGQHNVQKFQIQQHNIVQRIESPFSDYNRIQPLITNVVVQHNKHSKVVLPKLPKKPG